MPSFAAHLILAKEVLGSLENPNIKNNQGYFLLGSIGPDLPYYDNVFGKAIETFFEEKFNQSSPGFYSGYGDYLHSRTPNLFPMKMLEIIKKDKDITTDNQKLAFALGYLTHMAADQCIHPYVNDYAGSFYFSATSRQKHRTLEVYQDLFLFKAKFPDPDKVFFKEDFQSWVDIAPPAPKQVKRTKSPMRHMGEQETLLPKTFTHEWFRSFIQRAFFESYSVLIKEKEAEEWVRGFNSILQPMKSLGPYHDAQENIEKNSKEAKELKNMFESKDKDYLLKCFEPAKDLAKQYIEAATGFFDAQYISDKERSNFLARVPDVDLSSPLMKL